MNLLRDNDQIEFNQAVDEVLQSVAPTLEKRHEWERANIVERMIEPERVVTFRVTWVDDSGQVQINRGYRVQMNSAIGPYKGGLRFHPSVNLSILKFLAWEQTFKNALTGLPMGGAKGGAAFDPKGKSDGEIMRFCQSFMSELFRHIGDNTDVPAGDIGVGEREIGYLFGMYKKLQNQFTGVLTGKAREWGGSHLRPEATGWGLVYFADEMLRVRNDSLKGKICLISGSGNVAQYTAEKLIEYGAKVLTMSDSGGYIYDADGIDREKLDFIMELKNVRRGRLVEYYEKYEQSDYWNINTTNNVWEEMADCAFPCATENELNIIHAENLIKSGIKLVAEGANMPCTWGAIKAFKNAGVLFGPGKAANAGGVAVSGIEMTQNSQRLSWTREGVDYELKEIMQKIHKKCLAAADEYGMPGDYQAGANIAGFKKVANAMMDQWIV